MRRQPRFRVATPAKIKPIDTPAKLIDEGDKLSEKEIHKLACSHLTTHYPDVIYRTDGAGLRLHKRTAIEFASMQSSRAYPDLFIAKPMATKSNKYGWWFGLFIEVKKDGVSVYKKNGEVVASEHVREQVAMVERLEDLGYYACICIGQDSLINTIDAYLRGDL